MGRFKKAFAMILVVMLFVSNIGNGLKANAASSMEYRNKMDISMERGLVLQEALGEEFFDGGSGIEITDSADINLIRGNIKSVNSLKISITFQLKSGVAGSFFNLLEISSSAKNTDEMALIVGTNGVVYWMTGGNQGSTDWNAASGKSIATGSHTLELTISPKGMTYNLDGTEKSVLAATAATQKNTTNFVKAFFGGTSDASAYTDWRESIDSISIGALKEGSYQTHTNFKNFQGTISALTIVGVNDLSDLTGDGFFNAMFASNLLDNTWLFGGGVETQGRFEEIGSQRNYIGHFEEYVRWEKRVNGVLEGMQRYTINAGKNARDAVGFAEALNSYITRTSPRAVAYLIGEEDYCQGESGIPEFKEAISSIIETSLAMKDSTGCVVIELPHARKEAQMAENAKLYADAAAEVYSEIREKNEENKNRMALVDHLSKTNTDDFKNTMLTKDGLLNAKGHYEIAKQLSEAVYGSSAGFPARSDAWTLEPLPEEYLKETPDAIVSEDGLMITVPEEIAEDGWKYSLIIDGVRIEGETLENPYIVTGLSENAEYELTVQSKDGKRQLSTVEGTIAPDESAEILKPKGAIPQKIRELADDKEKPLTWIFMGDSITHGALHTSGYDSIAQLFEKYIKEDLGREDDIVVNTAVSGATAERTYANIYERMTKYKPDIVSIMLGTNDKTAANYEEKMTSIVQAIRGANKDAVIIFRTPIPARSSWASSSVLANVAAKMKNLAETQGNILFIDQYTDWAKEWNAYPYLNGSSYDSPDGVHSTPAGHARMAVQFIRECGLDTDAKIANLTYRFPDTKETSEIVPTLQIPSESAQVTVEKAALQESYGSGEIGELTIQLTDMDGTTYTKSAGLEDEAVTISVPENRRYLVNVTAKMKGNTAKTVTFQEQEEALITAKVTDSDRDAAGDVSDEISELGQITADDFIADEGLKETVLWLQEDYNSLTEVQKAFVSNDVIQLLKTAEAALDQYEAGVVTAQINAIGSVTADDMDEEKAAAIKAAGEAADALTEKQKQLLTADTMQLLTSAQTQVDWYRVNAAAYQINAIGSVTADDIKQNQSIKTAIETARAAYNALTKAQKEMLADSVKQMLTDAERALSEYEASSKGELAKKEDDPGKKGDEDQSEKIYENGNYTYQITDAQTAEVTGLKNETAKIQIPNTVALNGKSYKVTSVAAAAFRNNKKVTNVTIGKNVVSIGKSAFENCTKLKKVTINSTKLKKLGSKAFYKCKALKSITIKSKVLKAIGSKAFKGIHKQAVIRIPSGKAKK